MAADPLVYFINKEIFLTYITCEVTLGRSEQKRLKSSAKEVSTELFPHERQQIEVSTANLFFFARFCR